MPKYSFHPFIPGRPGNSAAPAARVYPRQLTLNPRARALLGECAYYSLHFDTKARALAIRSLSETDVDPGKRKTPYGRSFSVGKCFETFGVEITEPITCPVEVWGGFLVVLLPEGKAE